MGNRIHLRQYTYSNTNTYSDPDSNANTYSNSDTNSYSYSNTNANSGTKLRRCMGKLEVLFRLQCRYL